MRLTNKLLFHSLQELVVRGPPGPRVLGCRSVVRSPRSRPTTTHSNISHRRGKRELLLSHGTKRSRVPLPRAAALCRRRVTISAGLEWVWTHLSRAEPRIRLVVLCFPRAKQR
jgi:hypothetical protein